MVCLVSSSPDSSCEEQEVLTAVHLQKEPLRLEVFQIYLFVIEVSLAHQKTLGSPGSIPQFLNLIKNDAHTSRNLFVGEKNHNRVEFETHLLAATVCSIPPGFPLMLDVVSLQVLTSLLVTFPPHTQKCE